MTELVQEFDVPKPTCSLDSCGKPSFCRGWCQRHYDRWRVYGSPEERSSQPCATCGDPVPLSKSGQLPKYCGADCKPKKAPRTWSGLCSSCGVKTDGVAGYRKYCSRACQVEASMYPGGRPTQAVCVKCKGPIDFGLVRPSGRKLRVDTKKCLDCRRDNAILITVNDLAERDGTDCSLCGDPVDMSLKWPTRLAPTRDHIHPWSLGGTDDPDNLALAHFVCNIKKQNKVA